jgi:hypothetical protein
LNEPIIVPTYEKVLKRMGRISKRSWWVDNEIYTYALLIVPHLLMQWSQRFCHWWQHLSNWLSGITCATLGICSWMSGSYWKRLVEKY